MSIFKAVLLQILKAMCIIVPVSCLTVVVFLAFVLAILMYLVFGVGRTPFEAYMDNCGFTKLSARISEVAETLLDELRF